MDGQEYLNQISASNRPTKNANMGFLRSKFFIIGVGGAVALILIIIIGAMLGGSKGDEKSLSSALLLHINNTAEEVQKYQPSVKSYDLRSSSASLQSILTTTGKEIENHLLEKYNLKDKKFDKKIIEKADQAKQALDDELFEAKINGALDWTFAHKMAYEISLILSEESSVMNKSKDEAYSDVLKKSSDSLENLYNIFNDFSEAK